MKKSILGIVMILGLLSFGQAAILDKAVTWMNENNLTIFNTVTDYQPNNYIRRDEAAKLFVKFAKIRNKSAYVKTTNECVFSDLNDAHKDLKDIVVESCRLGIFQGANGKFMPRGSLTNEQAVAVLLRVIGETQSEVGVSYRSENYYNRAEDMLLFIDTPNMRNRKGLATRGDVGMGIYFMNNMTFNNTTIVTNIGLIKQIYIDSDGNKKLEIDYVQLGGPNECDGGVICIINENSKLRTFTVSNNVNIIMQTLNNTSDIQNISFDDFRQKFNDITEYNYYPNNYSKYLKTILYQITIKNGIIIKIEEQYMP